MKTIGIICEYNPFHNGHAHQLHTLAQEHPEAVSYTHLDVYKRQAYNSPSRPPHEARLYGTNIYTYIFS